MTRFRFLPATVIALCVLYAGICRGEESGTAVQFKLKPAGFASMEVGQIAKSGVNKKTGRNMDNTWMRQIISGLSVNVSLSERSSLIIGLEMQMYNDFPIDISFPNPAYRYLYFYPYLSQAEYSHSFGDISNPFLTVSAGYFQFKYNSDVRNLGEYLFRTGTYPQYILNAVDFPLARLMGLHASITPLRNLKADALFYTNLQWYAVGDWNLAGIASYKAADIVEVGLGLTLNSIISTDSTLTTPHHPSTVFHVTHYIDPARKNDSAFYSFKGAKLMGRVSIDLKKILPESEMLGKEDLRLYGEAAILGLKDYPRNLRGGIYYDSILERIPIMVGLNWPTHPFAVYFAALIPELISYYPPDHVMDTKERISLLSTGGAGIAAGVGTWFLEKYLTKKFRLDVLSLEIEWFGSRQPNDIGVITDKGLPLPGPIFEDGYKDYRTLSIYKNDNWKWSLYGTKRISKNYSVTFQVANDHLRPLAVNDQNVDFEEALHSTDHWYYMLKAAVGF